MSTKLENIVRPFQSAPAYLSAVTANKVPEAVEEAVLLIKEAANRSVDTVSGAVGLTVKQDDLKEQNRTVKKVRVENPDDPDQYVMVENTKTLAMQDKTTGKKHNWEFTPPA